MGTFDHLNAGLSAVADLGELARALREYPHFFGPRIIGAEVTQAIQYFRSHRHLTDPLDRAPDNSARLVAYKPAWVRVYVRGSAHGSVPMTGKVKVERRGPGSSYRGSSSRLLMSTARPCRSNQDWMRSPTWAGRSILVF